MKLSELRDRVQLSTSQLHDMIAHSKVVLPLVKMGGQGTPAEYDMASAMAAVIASQLVELKIPINRYRAGFDALHSELRKRPPLTWPQYRLCITPNEVHFEDRRAPFMPASATIALDLRPAWERVTSGINLQPEILQLDLGFGLHSAKQ